MEDPASSEQWEMSLGMVFIQDFPVGQRHLLKIQVKGITPNWGCHRITLWTETLLGVQEAVNFAVGLTIGLSGSWDSWSLPWVNVTFCLSRNAPGLVLPWGHQDVRLLSLPYSVTEYESPGKKKIFLTLDQHSPNFTIFFFWKEVLFVLRQGLMHLRQALNFRCHHIWSMQSLGSLPWPFSCRRVTQRTEPHLHLLEGGAA